MTETKHTPTIDDKWIVTATVLCERLGIAPKADAEHIVSGINRIRNSHTALVGALEKLWHLITYPVSTEITARGWNTRSMDTEACEYAGEIIDAALAGEKDAPDETVVTDDMIRIANNAFDDGVGDPNDYHRRMGKALRAALAYRRSRP